MANFPPQTHNILLLIFTIFQNAVKLAFYSRYMFFLQPAPVKDALFGIVGVAWHAGDPEMLERLIVSPLLWGFGDECYGCCTGFY